MIDDRTPIPSGAVLDAEICIVGAGAAGITLARESASTGKRVMVLVGGDTKDRAADHDLFRGFAAPRDRTNPSKRTGVARSRVST